MGTYYDDLIVEKNVVISDRNLLPTKVSRSEVQWVYARNDKYNDEDSDVMKEKIGKWMLFLPKDTADQTWAKIKLATASGDLWHSKVSTSDENDDLHAFMIYTKNYSDLNDVIQVLNYLETSGIKPPNKVIYYKTDQQTRAGIYSGKGKRASIYSSNTVRSLTRGEP